MPERFLQDPKGIGELPVWFWFLIALAGGFGEMYRAAAVPGLSWPELFKRVVLRAGASSLFGISTFMLTWWSLEHPLPAAALGILVGLIGADVSSALYERWFAKRLGLNTPPRTPGDA